MTNILLVCACIVSIFLTIDVIVGSCYFLFKPLSKYKIVKKKQPKQETKQEKNKLVPTGTPICVRVRVPLVNGELPENIEEILYNEFINKFNGM